MRPEKNAPFKMINSDFLPHMPTVIQILKDHNVKSAYLFGSVLTDRFNKDSDVDILVDLDKTQKIGLFRYVEMKLALQELLKREVDLVETNELLPFAQKTADRDKILIYERA